MYLFGPLRIIVSAPHGVERRTVDRPVGAEEFPRYLSTGRVCRRAHWDDLSIRPRGLVTSVRCTLRGREHVIFDCDTLKRFVET